MSNLSDKINDIHGDVREMKPIVTRLDKGFETMETRLRACETRCPVHDEKLKNLEGDTSNLWKQVRNRRSGDAGRPELSFWANVMEVLCMAPKLWHIALGAAALVPVVIALWRHITP